MTYDKYSGYWNSIGDVIVDLGQIFQIGFINMVLSI